MNEEKNQIHLGYGKPVAANGGPAKSAKKLTGCSGRAVRCRILAPADIRHIKHEALRASDETTKQLELEESIADMGVEQMIVAYTEPVTPEQLPGATWIPRKPGEDMHDKMDVLFTTKDRAILNHMYLSWHHINNKELEEIMGGMVGVVD
jgi:hypothetical protein